MQLLRPRHAAAGAAAVTALVLAGCASSAPGSALMADGSVATSSGAALSGTLNAGGSTFQLTFQEEAVSGFKAIQPNITVNYNGVGSGAGRNDLAANKVSMAASDSPIPDTEAAHFKGKRILYFPVVIGPVTLAYHLTGVPGLDLTAPVIAANFTKFLVDAAGSKWPLGTGSVITWPAGAAAGKGNNGVAQIVKSTPGAIGYVDYATAKAFRLNFASVENKDGNFVTPSPTTAAAAASQVALAPDETFSAVWAGGTRSYPITYQSWDLVYAKQPNANDVKMLRAYIGYLLGAGQELL